MSQLTLDQLSTGCCSSVKPPIDQDVDRVLIEMSIKSIDQHSITGALSAHDPANIIRDSLSLHPSVSNNSQFSYNSLPLLLVFCPMSVTNAFSNMHIVKNETVGITEARK